MIIIRTRCLISGHSLLNIRVWGIYERGARQTGAAVRSQLPHSRFGTGSLLFLPCQLQSPIQQKYLFSVMRIKSTNEQTSSQFCCGAEAGLQLPCWQLAKAFWYSNPVRNTRRSHLETTLENRRGLIKTQRGRLTVIRFTHQ